MTTERKQKLLLYAVLLMIMFAAALFMNRRFVQIDTCLDNGAAWDYDRNICSLDCVGDGKIWVEEKAACLNVKER
ncbi:hypothetical protein DES40_1124 [Litorimonas taeanensis]|uniref:Uncharacterized protein n=1 Tax=Litorimonas taeanensis TaxID=568099 RepID=A0A420WL98_9PROT|nr:hypothetical protein [Litorimonas taeanensis]RKQ71794.1 hypothetical protein DES40_1124 [Litorimonas taeanensis]